MMPDLGKYAATVLAAYAVSIILLIGLIAQTLIRSRKVKKQLSELEERRKK